MSKPDLEFILTKEGKEYKLFACRGAGKGCTRNKYRSSKKQCEDCVPCEDKNETLGEIRDRLGRGDA